MMTKRSLKHLVPLLAALLLAIGCERRPLEVYYQGVARVRVDVDWLDHFGMKPSGMTLMLYNDYDTIVRTVVTNNVESQVLYLYPEVYKMTIFSYSYDEYASMGFQRLGNHLCAAARAYELRGDHQLEDWEEDAAYMWAPEDIGVATDTIVITEDMVNNDLRFADYRDRNSLHPDTTDVVFNERPDPMTVKLFIKAKVKRRQSVQAIKGSISGMADGFYLNQVTRTQERGTLYLAPENWTLVKYGEEADSLGLIMAQIATFGLPHGKEKLADRDSTDNVLTLHLVLTDNTVQDCAFNVGKDLRYITPEGKEAEIKYREDLHDIRLELDLSETIVAPEKPPLQGGAGFNAWVDPYEDGGTFEFRF